MTKHIRRLEKETATWKSRYDAAQRMLAEVIEEKVRTDDALGLAHRRLFALQGICRKMQDQCRVLRGRLSGSYYFLRLKLKYYNSIRSITDLILATSCIVNIN